MQRPRHLNSLGYIIAGSATERASAQAMIAWGEKPDGALVHIHDASAGLADGLKCACGAPLVARKGDVRVHHFAHKAGTAEVCERAQLEALCNFAIAVLRGAGELCLPLIRGRQLATPVDEIRGEIFGQCAGLWVATVKGDKRSEVAVILTVRRGQQMPAADHFKAAERSAMLIDLSTHRNRRDQEIASVIGSPRDRVWLYNLKHPVTADGAQTTGPAEHGRSNAPRSSIRYASPKPQPAISEEEWQTLHYTELRRRVFGWTDKK